MNTAYALGFASLWRAIFYRIGIKLGLNKVKKISAHIETGNFFELPENLFNTKLKVNTQWCNQQCFFGWKVVNSTDIPNWHQSVLTSAEIEQPHLSWWSIPDFSPELGDIKGVWEASRFDWVLCFAQQASQGDETALNKLNLWLNDWSIHNPPYQGANWKCGQEASIRIMHLAMAAIILKQHDKSSVSLISFVNAHLQRILPTISYAVAQNNNHGTSEAAALFIGGSWLTLLNEPGGDVFYQQGRQWLENRAKHLIEEDGSFSQYSTTYHRVMLDSYSMAEVWRLKLALPVFSVKLKSKLQLATNWLYQFTQFDSGDVPNLGANDGARLLPLTDTDYRDFRPAVQLASVLFNHKKAWSQKGDWDLPLQWLSIEQPNSVLEAQSSSHFKNGGYCILRKGKTMALLNYPEFKFRPSQCDALHVDFWLNGENLLRDAGTYSYNAGDEHIEYFGGTAGHNTVQFDDKEQMPRLSRFLLGNWLNLHGVAELKNEKVLQSCQAGYQTKDGSHRRCLQLTDNALIVEDNINQFTNKATLRWRLASGDWRLTGNTATNGKHQLTIEPQELIKNIVLVEGQESRYYYQKQATPVLEVEFHQACSIKSVYQYV